MKITYSEIEREEELKNSIARDYFLSYDCTKIVGNIDFTVAQKISKTIVQQSLLWAEAKKGKSDIYKSLVQLILTIGKARTFDRELPPAYLGAFDSEKIALIAYNEIQDIFYVNDFNWNITPSNHEAKEFTILLDRVKNTLEKKSLIFNLSKDKNELNTFIKDNFVINNENITKMQIDKNNFVVIYNKWLSSVKPTIAVDWELSKKVGIIDADFYLADLLSKDNKSLKDKLYVLLKDTYYELDRKIDEMGLFTSKKTAFYDNQKAHNEFWNKYVRPPKEEYWDYIVERRDLLVPQDVRERKGSFFTPQIWVELSQKYLTDVLGENWQDDYYVWDCAAGTGNLLTGLTNKYNIWASTLDMQDVEVMKDRIDNGANLLKEHVFQFDFLNDSFDKLPKLLQEIINNEEKRKKLVIYINPPYKRGLGVANTNWHKNEMGASADELFAQFLFRIYIEIPNCIIGEFSKLKILQAPNFSVFRSIFLAKLEKMFIVPADTFDNVSGQFPVGFFIWDTSKKIFFNKVISDIYYVNNELDSTRIIINYDNLKVINLWLREFTVNTKNIPHIGILNTTSNDFQHQNRIIVVNYIPKGGDLHKQIDFSNLIKISIYYTVRKILEPTWLNDRDQFLYPNDKWETDTEFQNDCLTYTLFTNNIQSKFGTNHWIPFTEKEVDAKEKFESSFMTDFIAGKIKQEKDITNYQAKERNTPLEFSSEALAVFEVGRELWRYYFKTAFENKEKNTYSNIHTNVNASLYDIREYFQGRNDKGKMNNKSDDEQYNKLISLLRLELKKLAKKIEPKVYEYGFLKD